MASACRRLGPLDDAQGRVVLRLAEVQADGVLDRRFGNRFGSGRVAAVPLGSHGAEPRRQRLAADHAGRPGKTRADAGRPGRPSAPVNGMTPRSDRGADVGRGAAASRSPAQQARAAANTRSSCGLSRHSATMSSRTSGTLEPVAGQLPHQRSRPPAGPARCFNRRVCSTT